MSSRRWKSIPLPLLLKVIPISISAIAALICLISQLPGTPGRPYLLEREVVASSPDKTYRFVASRDGVLQIRNVNGDVLQQHPIPVGKFTGVSVVWLDQRRVRIYAKFRYPLKMDGESFHWNAETGEFD